MQVFSSEICKNFKNTFFTEHLWWLLPLPKQIKRNTLQTFLSKHNDATEETEVIIKFNESVLIMKHHPGVMKNQVGKT